MMKKSFLLFAIMSVFSATAQNYSDSVTTLRKEYVETLIDTSNHILNEEEVTNFKGVEYFPISESYKVKVTFKKKLGKEFKMPTSGTRTPIYRRYGYIDFEVNGKKCRLTVYQNVELTKSEDLKDYLFIPFRDATSSHSTYGGGRYLDFSIPTGTDVIIDFNMAYNPYCAYSHRYSCPIPPVENTLEVEITAGERYLEH